MKILNRRQLLVVTATIVFNGVEKGSLLTLALSRKEGIIALFGAAEEAGMTLGTVSIRKA